MIVPVETGGNLLSFPRDGFERVVPLLKRLLNYETSAYSTSSYFYHITFLDIY